MNIFCNHCHTEQEARISKEKPYKVICQKCGSKIDGISEFTIRSLLERHKFIDEEKGKFSFYCEPCKGIHRGLLQHDNKRIWVKCSNCGVEMKNVSDFTIRQMSKVIFTDEKK